MSTSLSMRNQFIERVPEEKHSLNQNQMENTDNNCEEPKISKNDQKKKTRIPSNGPERDQLLNQLLLKFMKPCYTDKLKNGKLLHLELYKPSVMNYHHLHDSEGFMYKKMVTNSRSNTIEDYIQDYCKWMCSCEGKAIGCKAQVYQAGTKFTRNEENHIHPPRTLEIIVIKQKNNYKKLYHENPNMSFCDLFEKFTREQELPRLRELRKSFYSLHKRLKKKMKQNLAELSQKTGTENGSGLELDEEELNDGQEETKEAINALLDILEPSSNDTGENNDDSDVEIIEDSNHATESFDVSKTPPSPERSSDQAHWSPKEKISDPCILKSALESVFSDFNLSKTSPEVGETNKLDLEKSANMISETLPLLNERDCEMLENSVNRSNSSSPPAMFAFTQEDTNIFDKFMKNSTVKPKTDKNLNLGSLSSTSVSTESVMTSTTTPCTKSVTNVPSCNFDELLASSKMTSERDDPLDLDLLTTTTDSPVLYNCLVSTNASMDSKKDKSGVPNTELNSKEKENNSPVISCVSLSKLIGREKGQEDDSNQKSCELTTPVQEDKNNSNVPVDVDPLGENRDNDSKSGSKKVKDSVSLRNFRKDTMKTSSINNAIFQTQNDDVLCLDDPLAFDNECQIINSISPQDQSNINEDPFQYAIPIQVLSPEKCGEDNTILTQEVFPSPELLGKVASTKLPPDLEKLLDITYDSSRDNNGSHNCSENPKNNAKLDGTRKNNLAITQVGAEPASSERCNGLGTVDDSTSVQPSNSSISPFGIKERAKIFHTPSKESTPSCSEIIFDNTEPSFKLIEAVGGKEAEFLESTMMASDMISAEEPRREKFGKLFPDPIITESSKDEDPVTLRNIEKIPSPTVQCNRNRLPHYLKSLLSSRSVGVPTKMFKVDDDAEPVQISKILLHPIVIQWCFNDTWLGYTDSNCQPPQLSNSQLDPSLTDIGEYFPFSIDENETSSASVISHPLEELSKLVPNIKRRRKVKCGKKQKVISTILLQKKILDWAFCDTLLGRQEDSPKLCDLLGVQQDGIWPSISLAAITDWQLGTDYPFCLPGSLQHKSCLLFEPLDISSLDFLLADGQTLPPVQSDLKQEYELTRIHLVKLLSAATYYIYMSRKYSIQSNSSLVTIYTSIISSFRPLIISQANALARCICMIRKQVLSEFECDFNDYVLPSLIYGDIAPWASFFCLTLVKKYLTAGNIIKLRKKS